MWKSLAQPSSPDAGELNERATVAAQELLEQCKLAVAAGSMYSVPLSKQTFYDFRGDVPIERGVAESFYAAKDETSFELHVRTETYGTLGYNVSCYTVCVGDNVKILEK